MAETGRRTEEIEITPEMIEAGLAEFFEYSPDFDNEREVVEAIYRAMAVFTPSRGTCR